ncbi:MAG: tetratricopeptide repeat protein, partial [Candidatus Njordarchaeota archaeon]
SQEALGIIEKADIKEKEEIYKSLAIILGKAGDLDNFRKSIKQLSIESKMEVLYEVIQDTKLDEKDLNQIIGEFLMELKSVDYDDEDACKYMTNILAYLGDYTRARGFANSFCSIIKTKDYSFLGESFRLLDEVDCADLKMILGDKKDGLEILKKVAEKAKNANKSRLFTYIFNIVDIASKHGLYDEAIKFMNMLEVTAQRGSCASIVLEYAYKKKSDMVDKLIEEISSSIDNDAEALLRVSTVLRKYNNEKWREFFERISMEDVEKIDVLVLIDILEQMADNGFDDMLEKLAQVPIYWEDLKRDVESLFKYAYILYATGRIAGGSKVFEDYINEVVTSKEMRIEYSFPIYYLKASLTAIKRYPEKIKEIDFDERLQEKLTLLQKHIILPQSIEQFLEKIKTPKYRKIASEKIAEEILLKHKCVGKEKVLILIPEKERLDEIISRVARRLMDRGNFADAITCVNLINDNNLRFELLTAMEHRCALKLCKELPTLLKRTIAMVEEMKKKNKLETVDEAKIRADLAIVFKFAGKNKEYEESLNEAIELAKNMAPKVEGNIIAEKNVAEVYGYLAASLYVQGDPRSDELLKKSVKYVLQLPKGLRIRVLLKIIIWLLFAGWFSAVMELLQLEQIRAALPLIRASLIDAYVRNEMYDEALNTALSMCASELDEIETYISYANSLIDTPKREEANKYLEMAMSRCSNLADEETKIRTTIKIAEAYARAGIIDKAREILTSLSEKIKTIKDNETREKLISLMAPAYYLIETASITEE